MRAALAYGASSWLLWPFSFALRWDVAVPVVFAVGRVGFDERLAIAPALSVQQLMLIPLAFALADWIRRGFVVVLADYWLLVALLMVSLAVGLAHTDAIEYGWDKAAHAALWIVLAGAFVSAHAEDASGVRRVLLPFAVLGTTLALVGLALYLGSRWSGRLAVVGGGPIVFSRWVGTSLVLGVVLLGRRHGRLLPVLPWAVGLGAVLFFAVLLAASKGSLLALAVGGFYAYWRGFTRWGRWRRAAALLSATSVSLVVARIIEPAIFLRVLISPLQPGSAGSYGARLDFLRQASDFASELSLFGLGVGGWATAAGGVDARAYPHNLMAEILTEHGWFFGLPILLAMVWLVVRAWRGSAHRPETAVLAVRALTLFWLLAVCFSGDLVDSRMLFLCLALLEAVSRWPREALSP